MELVKIFGTSALALGLMLWACSDDEGSSTSQSAASSTTASGAGGSGGGSCMGDLTGQAGGMLICNAQATDTECIGCTRMSCCSELQACLPDATCRCLLECFIAGCDPVQCLVDCGSGPVTEGLINCVEPNCEVCLQM